MGNTDWIRIFVPFFGGESHKSREGGLGRTAEGVTGVHDVHDVGEHVGWGRGDQAVLGDREAVVDTLPHAIFS